MPKKGEMVVANSNNEKLVKEFQKLIKQIQYEMDHAPDKKEEMKNSFRLRQLTNATKVITNFPTKITTSSQLDGIKGIGPGTKKRIDEVLSQGNLSEVHEDVTHDKYLKYIENLEEVIGIGRKFAYKLVKKYKITTVKQLEKAHKDGKIELNDKILLGLKYHGVYKKNIPRSEIASIDSYVHKIANKIDPELVTVICGSYRRLKSSSNDIDVLLTVPMVKTKKDLDTKYNYLRELVTKLKKDKFLVDDMTDKKFSNKYMGFCKLKQGRKKFPVRRIDIRYMPYESYYAALLYFTGSGDFNRKMRTIAISMGYKLNEYGLYKIDKDKETLIPASSEKDIFDQLGMEYVEPNRR